MGFSYTFYSNMIRALKENNYTFVNYENYKNENKSVILRHDIDNSISAARELAQIEEREGVNSTFFVLLKTDFYNVASAASLHGIRDIQKMGHEIGLHFDEKAYGSISHEEVIEKIVHECKILGEIIDTSIKSVSMHRPSKDLLEANIQIPGIINSYANVFFSEFKYLSDSRHNWREPVMDIIQSNQYERLHILTHAIWYHEQDEDIKTTLRKFIERAKLERYESVADNIRDFDQIIRREEIAE